MKTTIDQVNNIPLQACATGAPIQGVPMHQTPRIVQQRIGNLSSRSTLRRSGLRAYYTPRASAPMSRIKIPVVPQPSRIVVERARHKNAKSDEFVRHEIRYVSTCPLIKNCGGAL